MNCTPKVLTQEEYRAELENQELNTKKFHETMTPKNCQELVNRFNESILHSKSKPFGNNNRYSFNEWCYDYTISNADIKCAISAIEKSYVFEKTEKGVYDHCHFTQYIFKNKHVENN